MSSSSNSYSLLGRSVEQELIPMALEFVLGVTPWSPLKSGALSGKDTRAHHGGHRAARRADEADVRLTSEHVAVFPSIQHGASTVNGVYAPPSGFVVEKGEMPY